MNTRNSYNRNQYQSSRYNNTGTFIPASQQPQQGSQPYSQQSGQQWKQEAPSTPSKPFNNSQQPQQQNQQQQQPQAQPPVQEPIEEPELEPAIDLDTSDAGEGDGSPKKKWMKKGFKVSMRERRRRQNKQLRRLLNPKNALMVLNELTPDSRHECTVLPEAEPFNGALPKQYVAMLNVAGIEYRGCGPSKLQAKNSAAEGVIRDMLIKQMNSSDNASPSDDDSKMETDDDKPDNSPAFPMIQLASYALHKLFTDWQTGGFKVPQMGPNKQAVPISDTQSVASTNTSASVPPKAPRKVPVLPPNAASMHPCVLLSQMRGALVYSFVACENVKPNSQIFSMAVSVDGVNYIGKATNKKEARKLAAQKALEALFQIEYPEEDKKLPIEDM